MKTLRIFTAFILATVLTSCHNDDDTPTHETVLATLDYSNTNGYAIPSLIFANDKDGNLLASIQTNHAPGVYNLNATGYNGSTYTLSFYNDSDQKDLYTYGEVPVGMGLSHKAPIFSESSITINYSFPGVTEYTAWSQGFSNGTLDATDDGLGNIKHVINYNAEKSGEKLFLKIKYKNAANVYKYGYLWVDNYKSQSEIHVSISNFTAATLSDPLINDDGSGELFSFGGILNGNYLNLGSYVPSYQYFHITEGFEGYYYYYISDHFTKRGIVTSFPTTIDAMPPNWTFSYALMDKKLKITSLGNHLLSRLESNSSGNEKNFDIILPNQNSQTFNLPELPGTIQAIYKDHFANTGTPVIYNYQLDGFTSYTNYQNYLEDYFMEKAPYEGNESLYGSISE